MKTSQSDCVTRLFREAARHIKVPGYRVWIKSHAAGHCYPASRRIARQLNEWFSRIDRKGLLSLASRNSVAPLDELPSLNLVDEKSGWSFDLAIWPHEPDNVIPDCLAAIVGPDEALCIPLHDRLRTATKEKIRQHRANNLPVIVAIANNDWPGDPSDHDVLDVLLGTRCFRFRRGSPNDVDMDRRPDGLWNRPIRESPNLAGLIITSMCFPWTVPTEHLTLYLHPMWNGKVLKKWPFRKFTWDRNTGEPIIEELASPRQRLATLVTPAPEA